MIIELSGIDCFVNQLLKYLIGGGTLAICIAVSNFIYLTFIKGMYKCFYLPSVAQILSSFPVPTRLRLFIDLLVFLKMFSLFILDLFKIRTWEPTEKDNSYYFLPKHFHISLWCLFSGRIVSCDCLLEIDWSDKRLVDSKSRMSDIARGAFSSMTGFLLLLALLAPFRSRMTLLTS